jgi:apolipoprotein D and lipocalin family protein
MKKLMALSAVTLISTPVFADGITPRTVNTFDLDRYMGQWFEIESTQHTRQTDCTCTSARYSLNTDDSIRVINSCRRGNPNGVLSQVEGNAIPNTLNPAALTFNTGRFPFLFPNYFITMVDDDYSFAVISAPFKSDLWVLARSRTLSAGDLKRIHTELKNRGYDVERLRPTLQAGCPVEQDEDQPQM